MTTSAVPTVDRPAEFRLPDRAVAAALGAAWAPLALGETLLGDLDALDDVALVADGSARIAAAGLLHCASGVLLAYAAVGLTARLRRRLIGRVAAWLLLVAAVCLGAFGMFHLVALETASAGLDPAAMNAFLERFSVAPGYWALPLAVIGLLAYPLLTVVCVSLARAGIVRWRGPAIAAAATVAHAVGGQGLTELLAGWVMTAGLALVAVDLAPRGRAVRHGASAQ